MNVWYSLAFRAIQISIISLEECWPCLTSDRAVLTDAVSLLEVLDCELHVLSELVVHGQHFSVLTQIPESVEQSLSCADFRAL